jgi:tropinone reductase I
MSAGKLHVLVNNVGTNIRKPTVDYTAEDFDKVFSTNLQSAFSMAQLCHSMLKGDGDSSVIFISSVAGGPLSMRSGTLYAMTKGTAWHSLDSVYIM